MLALYHTLCILTYMARVNIYIKKEDEALWDAIEDKPRFIHGALQLTTTDYWEKLYADWENKQAVVQLKAEGQGKQ